jgi:hypothetical protein
MEITLVNAARPGDRDRAYLEVHGVTRRGPIHVIPFERERADRPKRATLPTLIESSAEVVVAETTALLAAVSAIPHGPTGSDAPAARRCRSGA